MMKTAEAKKKAKELGLIRTIAGASRPLDEDMEVTELQAIDRLQKLYAKFQEHWIRPPWLVLEDCYTLPVNLSVAEMLEQMSKHGKPIAIVGPVLLPGKRKIDALRLMFRSDKKSQQTAEVSAQAAVNDVMERIRRYEEKNS